MNELLSFLIKLKKAKIYYSLASPREGAIMVEIAVPGERWEVEFMGDGAVEIEVFRSDGKILDKSSLDRLFERFAD